MTFKYKTTRLLTRPTISMKKEGTECFVKIEKEMYTGKVMKGEAKAAADKPMEPATILDVINLETGEQAQLVVPAMLKSVLEDDYDHDYVGKCFHIKNQGKKDAKAGGGQRYNQLLIEEIEEFAAAASDKAAAKK